MKQQLGGRRVAGFALLVTTPYPARTNPHPLGHCMRIGTPRYPKQDQRVHLYVELEGN